MNSVEITGKIYNPKVTTTLAGKSITRFGLSIYTGKNKEGKSQYGFIDCKYFGNLVVTDTLKDIKGRLTVDTWEKDGKKFSKPEIIVETVNESEMFKDKQEEVVEQKEDESPFNDDIPF